MRTMGHIVYRLFPILVALAAGTGVAAAGPASRPNWYAEPAEVTGIGWGHKSTATRPEGPGSRPAALPLTLPTLAKPHAAKAVPAAANAVTVSVGLMASAKPGEPAGVWYEVAGKRFTTSREALSAFQDQIRDLRMDGRSRGKGSEPTALIRADARAPWNAVGMVFLMAVECRVKTVCLAARGPDGVEIRLVHTFPDPSEVGDVSLSEPGAGPRVVRITVGRRAGDAEDRALYGVDTGEWKAVEPAPQKSDGAWNAGAADALYARLKALAGPKGGAWDAVIVQPQKAPKSNPPASGQVCWQFMLEAYNQALRAGLPAVVFGSAVHPEPEPLSDGETNRPTLPGKPLKPRGRGWDGGEVKAYEESGGGDRSVGGGKKAGPECWGLKMPKDTREFVFAIDCSGRALPAFDETLEELTRSLGTLAENQAFHIIGYSKDSINPLPDKALLPAADANKRKALKWLQDLRAAGWQSSPIPALQAAFAAFRASPGKTGRVLVIVTAGEFAASPSAPASRPAGEAVGAWLRKHNADRSVRVFVVSVGGKPAPEAEAALRAVAKDNGGEYRHAAAP